MNFLLFKKKYDIIGIGNALMDIEVKINDTFLKENSFEKASMKLIKEKEREQILKNFKKDQIEFHGGGSVVNSLRTLSKLKNKVALIGRLGNDSLGDTYSKKLKKSNVDLFAIPKGNATGTSIVMITPDAERTMLTTLACAPLLEAQMINQSIIKKCKILYIEGYLWDSKETIKTVKKAMKIAKENKIKIAFSASDFFCVDRHFKDFIHLFTNEVDIFFCNQKEANALAKENNPKKAREKLGKLSKILCITDGEKGSYIYQEKKLASYIPPTPVKKVVDTTGAGDAYAAAILNGILKNQTIKQMGSQASNIASKVIAKIGARY